jgi:hypothetical protein
MSCGEPDRTTDGTAVTGRVVNAYDRTTMVTEGSSGCAQQEHRTQREGHFPSGWVSVTDVHVSGVTNAMTPDASPRSNARTAISKTRDTASCIARLPERRLLRDRNPADGTASRRSPMRIELE